MKVLHAQVFGYFIRCKKQVETQNKRIGRPFDLGVKDYL